MKLVNVQVIKDELERLIRNYRFYSSAEAKYRCEAYKELSEWLDGLEVEEPSKDLDEYKEVSFELIPYSANIAVGGNEYFLQAKVTDKDLSQIGVNGFLYKLKLKVKA